MKMNRLGRTDIMVSELCLGSMTWGTQNSEAEGHEQLDYAVDAGINFVDTAEMYPTTPRKAETTGRTEEILGTWLKNRADRDDIIVATKVTGEGNSDIRDGARVTGAILRESLEGSLKRLQTECVDLFQLHWPNRGSYHFRQHWTYDPNNLDVGQMDDEVADILSTVDALVKEGKLRTFGLSNESAWGTMKWLSIAEREGLPRVVSMQNEYSLLCRVYDTDMAEVSVLEDVGLLAFSPLAAGILSGKYRDGALPEGSRKTIGPNLGGRYNDHSVVAANRYVDVAHKHGLDPSAMALAFCTARPFMASVIIGATTMDQLRINIAAAELTLSDEVLADIAAVYRDVPLPM